MENGRIAYAAAESDGSDGRYSARILSPDGRVEEVALVETAPGEYRAEWTAPEEGAYAITVLEDGSAVLEGGYVESYSGEYDLASEDISAAFERAVADAGGRMLADGDSVVRTDLGKARTRRDITDILAGAALSMFVADVALRRLSWDRALEKRLDRRRKGESRERPARHVRRSVQSARQTGESRPPEEASAQLLDMMKKRRKM